MIDNSIYMINQKSGYTINQNSVYNNQNSVYMLNQKPLCMINQVEWDEKSLKSKITIQSKFNTNPNNGRIHALPKRM